VTSAAYQDLSRFRLPPGFRGRPAWFVQLWWIVQATLFRLSPRFCYGWRRFLLRAFGARVGHGVLVRSSAEVTFPWRVTIGDRSWIGDDVVLYSLGPITVGDDCVVSQRSYLCAGSHDYRSAAFDMRAAPIVVEDEAWIASDVFVGPGVRIGAAAVVGARSTVLRDLPPAMVCAGEPAVPLHPRRRG
jgi:putative colanic acid biosynthesis acetyltransferase WcaF